MLILVVLIFCSFNLRPIQLLLLQLTNNIQVVYHRMGNRVLVCSIQ